MTSPSIKHVDQFVKYGAIAVLTLWVGMQELEIRSMKSDYKDCMQERVNDAKQSRGTHAVGILPDKFRIKRES